MMARKKSQVLDEVDEKYEEELSTESSELIHIDDDDNLIHVDFQSNEKTFDDSDSNIDSHHKFSKFKKSQRE